MIKYVKWIFLVMFIISLIIMLFFFYNFMKKRNSIDDNTSLMNEIYDETYLRTGISLYEDEVLIDENLSLVDSRYLIFSDQYVTYCNPIAEDALCNDYNYSFDDGIINIDSEDYFVVKGEYSIVITDVGFDLLQKVDNVKVVYHFSKPVG